VKKSASVPAFVPLILLFCSTGCGSDFERENGLWESSVQMVDVKFPESVDPKERQIFKKIADYITKPSQRCIAGDLEYRYPKLGNVFDIDSIGSCTYILAETDNSSAAISSFTGGKPILRQMQCNVEGLEFKRTLTGTISSDEDRLRHDITSEAGSSIAILQTVRRIGDCSSKDGQTSQPVLAD